jgi:predicted TIM-barrel fold metal-dependent hydrolase
VAGGDVSDEQRYLVVSSDSHAGPSLERDLRQYCPASYLQDFDDFAQRVRHGVGHGHLITLAVQNEPALRDALARTAGCPGQTDPTARLRDMDDDGVAAEVIFAGGQNGEMLPFIGIGWDAGSRDVAHELRAVGEHIWNEWLADFVSPAPERLLGVMQVPIWDVDAAVRELEWGRNKGLRAVNLPAPRSDLAAYNDPVYEPFWSACEALRLPLVTHGGGGDAPMGFPGAGGKHLYLYESGWLSRRHLWQLIFGGVFHNHPTLNLVFTEQRVRWVGPTLAELDSIYYSEDWARELRVELPKSPSEYWTSNCYNSGSFLTGWEAEMRDEVGLSNLLWGSDYPHYEGTWPCTKLAMRNAFANVPETETRRILGENALSAYGLDATALRRVADRIGPTPTELRVPLEPEEWPDFRSAAFRAAGHWSS